MARFAVPITHLVNNDASSVAAGWKLNFYATGTTARKNTFSDNALTTANDNPVVADSAGRFADVFMESGTYKVVLTDDASVEIWTADPVDGAVGASGAVIAKTAAYTVAIDDATKVVTVDATAGAVTVTLLPAATAGDGFEVTVKKIDSSVNAVTIDGNGAETIDGATTLVLGSQYHSATLRCDGAAWHLVTKGLNTQNTWTKTQSLTKGADIASATSMALGTDGNYFDITGTTTIATITGVSGTEITLQTDGAVQFTDSATLDMGGANITSAAGDRFKFFMLTASLAQMVGRVFEGFAGRGAVLQQVYIETTTTATGTNNVPIDTTPPQIGEMNEVLQLAITPLSATSKLMIEGYTLAGEVTNLGSTLVGALFETAVNNNAIQVYVSDGATTGDFGTLIETGMLNPRRRIASSGTTTRTFKFAVAIDGTGDIRWNGAAASDFFSTSSAAFLMITEYA